MNKQQFLQRFSYHGIGSLSDAYLYQGTLRQASVLIPLIHSTNGLEIVFTKRAEHLKHHPGQISFPGGKVEEHDANVVCTALREAHEEIGLKPTDVDIVGKLNEHHTITGFNITPIVAFIPNDYPFIVDENEVTEIFTVPFKHFIDENNHLNVKIKRQGIKHNIYFMPYLKYNIWGVTAAILKDLVVHLK